MTTFITVIMTLVIIIIIMLHNCTWEKWIPLTIEMVHLYSNVWYVCCVCALLERKAGVLSANSQLKVLCHHAEFHTQPELNMQVCALKKERKKKQQNWGRKDNSSLLRVKKEETNTLALHSSDCLSFCYFTNELHPATRHNSTPIDDGFPSAFLTTYKRETTPSNADIVAAFTWPVIEATPGLPMYHSQLSIIWSRLIAIFSSLGAMFTSRQFHTLFNRRNRSIISILNPIYRLTRSYCE